MPAIEIPAISTTPDARALPERRTRNRLRHRLAHIAATCAMGAWLFLAITPVVVVICAIR